MRLPSILRLPPDSPALIKSRPINKLYRFFGLDSDILFDHDRTVASPYIGPMYLGAIRILLGLYMLTSFIVYFSILAAQKNKFLRKQAWKLLGDIMFHSYLGMAVYFFFSGYHTIVFAIRRRNPLILWVRPLQLAHLILQTTVFTFPLLCTFIYLYWMLPALPAWHTRALTLWRTTTFYMLNTLFSFVELVLNASRPRPWSHLIVIILILGLYLAFHSILVVTSGGKVWIYTVFKFSLVINKGWISALRVLGLCILATVSFCIIQSLLWVKCRYLGGVKLSQTGTELGIGLRSTGSDTTTVNEV
jgi:hypothetical protein